SAVETGRLAREDVTGLGDVLAGRAPGRSSAEEITAFDSTGLAIQDLAIALAALERAGELDLPTIDRQERDGTGCAVPASHARAPGGDGSARDVCTGSPLVGPPPRMSTRNGGSAGAYSTSLPLRGLPTSREPARGRRRRARSATSRCATPARTG